MNNIGHVAYERRGENLYLRCNNCGLEETVVNFEGGGRPRLFGFSGLKSGDIEYAKCHECLMVHGGEEATLRVSRTKPSRVQR